MLTADFLAEFTVSYGAAWNDRDPAALAPLVTPDVHWIDPALPTPALGLAAVQQFMRDSWTAFPDLRFEPTGPACLDVSGSVATWPWRMIGTNDGPIDPPGFAATGKRLQVDGIDVWEFEGERIARYRAYYDMGDLARQLGLQPAPGSTAERLAVSAQRLQARFRARKAA